MSIADGQPVDQVNSNAAFASKTTDNTISGVQTLNNVGSATISDLQLLVNKIKDAAGVDEGSEDGTTYSNFSVPANTIDDGDDHEEALSKLANKFDGATGHTHDGTAGDGPNILSTNVSGFTELFGTQTRIEAVQTLGNNQAAQDITGLSWDKDDVQTVIGWMTVYRQTAGTEGRRAVIQFIASFERFADAWTVDFPQISGTIDKAGVAFTFTDTSGVLQIRAATNDMTMGGAYTDGITTKAIMTFDTEA